LGWELRSGVIRRLRVYPHPQHKTGILSNVIPELKSLTVSKLVIPMGKRKLNSIRTKAYYNPVYTGKTRKGQQ